MQLLPDYSLGARKLQTQYAPEKNRKIIGAAPLYCLKQSFTALKSTISPLTLVLFSVQGHA